MDDAATPLAEQVGALRWFHTLHLPGGIVTPGAIDSSRLLARLDLPASLAGKTVLDVGAWDGYHSFECARRGALVLATDSYSWGGGGWGTQDGMRALALLKRFGSVTVLNGHIHQLVQKVEGNMTFHTAM